MNSLRCLYCRRLLQGLGIIGMLCLVLLLLEARPLPAASAQAPPPAPSGKQAQQTPGQKEPPKLTPEQQELDRLKQEGVKAFYKGDFPTAEKAFKKGLEKAQALKDEKEIANFLNNLGLVYYSLAQFDKALEYYSRALAIEEKIGNQEGIAYSLNNLGVVYYSLGQFDKAEASYARALSLFESVSQQVGEPAQVGSFQEMLPHFYEHYAALKMKSNHPQQSMLLLEQARGQGLAR